LPSRRPFPEARDNAELGGRRHERPDVAHDRAQGGCSRVDHSGRRPDDERGGLAGWRLRAALRARSDRPSDHGEEGDVDRTRGFGEGRGRSELHESRQAVTGVLESLLGAKYEAVVSTLRKANPSNLTASERRLFEKVVAQLA